MVGIVVMVQRGGRVEDTSSRVKSYDSTIKMHRQLQTPELECLAWNIFLYVGDHILKKNF